MLGRNFHHYSQPKVNMGNHGEEANGFGKTTEHGQEEQPVRLGEWKQPGPGLATRFLRVTLVRIVLIKMLE